MTRSLFTSAIISLIVLIVFSCTKDNEPPVGATNKVILNTNSVQSIGSDSAVGVGTILSDGGDAVTESGVCWSLSDNPTISQNRTNEGVGSGAFNSVLRNLSPKTTYYVRAYLVNAQGTFYGSQVSFETLAAKPKMETNPATFITFSSINTGGNVISDGGAIISREGVCWSATNSNPTIADSSMNSGAGSSNFSITINNLSPNTLYYIRAFGTNSAGTGYGNVIQVKTLLQPTISTASISSITTNQAVGGGVVSSDGGAAITERGICWNTWGSPTIANSKTFDGSGVGSYTSQLTGLQPNTTYYVCAYATNSGGTTYGQQVTFKTLNYLPPSITTSSISSIAFNSAIGGGKVSNDGGTFVTQRGICWNTSGNPTTINSKTIDGSGTGSFSSQLTYLQPNTIYYVRAYATNAAGTSYGQEVIFKTLNYQLASVTTFNIGSITSNSASGGGSVSNDGGTFVTQRGICWNTSGSPTVINSKTINGSGTGSFSSQLTGLQPNTTYYVRAYATNTAGTSYGQTVIFKTSYYQLPSVTTSSIYSITSSSAVGEGNVISDGGYTVTQRGLCWSTSQNPTISNSRTINGWGTGSFSSQLTGLQPNTVYYVRAYATNAAGTSYGQQVKFVTSYYQWPSVTTSSISSITRSSAIGGGKVLADGEYPITQRGVCWSTYQNPTISSYRTIDGTGTGSFWSSISGLRSGTTYYVRAYVTNALGTFYGAQTSFRTYY